MMKPEPSELVLRGGCISLRSPPLGLPPRRFLKKSSKNSSNGEPGGNCGIASLPPPPPLASTLCEVEILTTESITFSAMSAMPSGPRALAGTEVSKLAALSEIAIPIRRRRRLKAGPVMSASLQRVKFDAQCPRTGPARKHLQLIIRRKTGTRRLTIALTPQLLAPQGRHQSGMESKLGRAIARQRTREVPKGNRASAACPSDLPKNDGENLPPHEPDQ